MKREFIEVPSFSKKWKALGFTDDDLLQLQQYLLRNPDVGDMMVGTGGLRKIRFAFDKRGKSGSARVCYIDFAFFEKMYLINVFQKNEKENLTDAEKKQIKDAIALLKIECEKNRSSR